MHEVMRVHREEGVFPSIYPCSEFTRNVGILQDFQTLVSNVGLEDFIVGEPYQYDKLTVSVVQDFSFSWASSNPMDHYKIYNIDVNLPFDDFCAAIKVPQWGSIEKIRGQPRALMDLYKEMCQWRSFSEFVCLHHFCLTLIAGKAGHFCRMSLMLNMESHGQSVEDDGEWAGDDFAQHSGGFQP